MKTQEMFTTLRAFADLAEVGRAEELRSFANVFKPGKDEAVSARIKSVLRHWPEQSPHASGLRQSLVVIAAGLTSCGARKQADDFHALLLLFKGVGTAPVEDFVVRIAEALAASSVKAAKPRKQEQPQVPDRALVSQLAEELKSAAHDPVAFAGVVERLHDSKLVSTPTLGAVANRFLGKSKGYKGRKPAIDDIVKRQKLDARSLARGKALEPIGV